MPALTANPLNVVDVPFGVLTVTLRRPVSARVTTERLTGKLLSVPAETVPVTPVPLKFIPVAPVRLAPVIRAETVVPWRPAAGFIEVISGTVVGFTEKVLMGSDV